MNNDLMKMIKNEIPGVEDSSLRELMNSIESKYIVKEKGFSEEVAIAKILDHSTNGTTVAELFTLFETMYRSEVNALIMRLMRLKKLRYGFGGKVFNNTVDFEQLMLDF